MFVEDSLHVHVATFDNVPDSGLMTTITVGVSAHELQQAVSRTAMRQELVTTVDRRYRALPWHEIVMAVAKEMLEKHEALMFGQVLGPRGPLFPEARWCKATALLVGLPAFFDADFAEPELDNDAVIIAELIPITTTEADSIKQFGWTSFLDRVDSGEINVLDLERD